MVCTCTWKDRMEKDLILCDEEVQSAAVAASPSGPTDAEIEAGYNAYCKRLGFQNYPLSWQYWLEAVRWSEQWRSATEPRVCPTATVCSCPAICAVDLVDAADMYRAVFGYIPNWNEMTHDKDVILKAWQYIEAKLRPAPAPVDPFEVWWQENFIELLDGPLGGLREEDVKRGARRAWQAARGGAS